MRSAAASVIAVLALALAVPTSATAVDDGPPPESTESIEVADATLAWGVSDQSNARSHNPTAINFLAAGVANPGRGGVELPRARWKAVVGDVSIQKRTAAGAWRTATWAGLGTDPHGAPIGMSGPFSGHRVLLEGGAGTLDPGSEDATLAWEGTFSVVYYGGNSIFTVTDPRLEVSAGEGKLTGKLGGWVSDREDPTVWKPVRPRRAPLATLGEVDVTDTGLVVEPAYRGVEVSGSVEQVRSGEDWGSFPAGMVAFLRPLGIDQFWYSTGLSTDGTKLPSPITVGVGGASPPEQEQPAPEPSPTPTPTPSNPVVTPPPPSPAPAPAPQVPAPAPASPNAAAPQVPSVPAVPAAPQEPAVSVQPQALQAAAPAPEEPVAGSGSVAWWISAALLLGAAVLLLIPVRRPN